MDAYDHAREAYEAADDARHALAGNPRTVGSYHAHAEAVVEATRAFLTTKSHCDQVSRKFPALVDAFAAYDALTAAASTPDAAGEGT